MEDEALEEDLIIFIISSSVASLKVFILAFTGLKKLRYKSKILHNILKQILPNLKLVVKVLFCFVKYGWVKVQLKCYFICFPHFGNMNSAVNDTKV